ncbi:hypothetical protein [Cytobacillus kochii]|uniref:hypothetical protein n=1 Tax=Cytobacillus kochii TaxID=859143 RepID=UPI002040204A|nr:hypothetical protein [Cytobacillus kochii]MCM3323284.1 hypothetical protein [Cytobacillus kochii]MCM3345679.1 hypothetical protein [Cytobacillus kochii]
MSIITKKDLKEKIIYYNLIPMGVSSLNISNQIHLNIDKVEDFLKFVSSSAFEYVYYYYTYYNIEKYIIPIDWYCEYSKEFKAVVNQHNQHIESLDFNSPKSLTLFTLQGGTLVGIQLDNHWIENQEIYIAEETIEIIEAQFNREVKKISDYKKDQYKDDEHKLRNIIFNDPEFQYCKNQDLRYWYLIELLEEENMKKYKYLVQPYGIAVSGKVKMFMDKTWILFKEQKK